MSIDVVERIALLGVGACTCLTKTPDIAYHIGGCRYREIMEIADAVEAERDEIIEMCSRVAEDLTVIEGEPSPELLHEMENDVLIAVEAAGNITKRRIVRAIRSLKQSPVTGKEGE